LTAAPRFLTSYVGGGYESHTVEQTVGNFQEAKVGPDKSLEGGAKMRRKLVVSEQAFYPRRSEYEGLNP